MSMKKFEEYVRLIPYLPDSTKRKMLAAFGTENAGPRLDELINHSPEEFILPGIHDRLNKHWARNFKPEDRFKG